MLSLLNLFQRDTISMIKGNPDWLRINHEIREFTEQMNDPLIAIGERGEVLYRNSAYMTLPEICRKGMENAPYDLINGRLPENLNCLFRLKSLKLGSVNYVLVQRAHQMQNPAETVLKTIISNTADAPDIFHASARALGQQLGWRYVAITRFIGGNAVDVLAFWDTAQWQEAQGYVMTNKPCEVVAKKQSFTVFMDAQDSFPRDDALKSLNVQVYAGLVYRDANNQPLGHVMVMHDDASVDISAAEQALSMTSLALSSHFELLSTSENLRMAESKAKTDALTQIANRFAFDEYLQQVMASPQTGHLLMSIDLDGLKLVNDQFGHAQGDRFLQMFADEIQGIGRADDKVFRTGGDEFLYVFENSVALPVSILRQRVAHVMDNIRQRLNMPVGCSVGFARLSETAGDVDRWLALADRRMYTDKRSKPKLQ